MRAQRRSALVAIVLLCLSGALQAQEPGKATKFEPADAGSGPAGVPVQFATALAPTQPNPARFPTQGIIDPYAAQSSGEPGVLVPLAQSQSAVGHWMDAVEAVGPAVPLADPNFEGTVFIPADAAFEQAYPQLKQPAATGADAFGKAASEKLAGQLNSLTVPGVALQLSQLQPGQVMKTADGGSLRVLPTRAADGSLQLQQSPSGVVFSIIEPDLQSGNAIGHVIDRLIPQVVVSTEKAAREEVKNYTSAMAVLQDPSLELSEFARLAKTAGLAMTLSDPAAELTLFAPNNEAMAAFLSGLPSDSRASLTSNQTLADQLVSAHLLSGVALGTKALEALPPDKTLKSQAGQVLDVRAVSSLGPPRVTQESAKVAGTPASSAGLSIDGSRFVSEDLTGGRAVVHVVDKVLVPQSLAQQLQMPGSTNSTLWQVPLPSSSAGGSSWPSLAAGAAAAAAAAVWLL